MHLQRQDFIPVGCLGVFCEDVRAVKDTWDAAVQQTRKISQLQPLPPPRAAIDGDDAEVVPIDLEKQLGHMQEFQLTSRLFHHGWIDLECTISQDGSFGTLQIYLLPDDVCRGLVDKTDVGLQRARQRLLHSLDFSKAAWKGLKPPCAKASASLTLTSGEHGEDASLLQAFNTMPSPDPDPSMLSDQCLRDLMSDILKGTVSGVHTKLHPYQCRSVALMLQKEVEPGMVTDPRLVAVPDRDASTFYTDPVNGTILKEPRHYDGIAGGILAEEMGSGKTLICLALILAARNIPSRPPVSLDMAPKPTRKSVGSLADMAAACVTRNAVPWKLYSKQWKQHFGYQLDQCEQVIQRNRAYYFQPPPKLRRTGRHRETKLEPTKMCLSDATIAVVPNNLVSQWKQEIAKHTTDLKFCIMTKDEDCPTHQELTECDLVLFSQSCFQGLVKRWAGKLPPSLLGIHFKRCIVDEGHKLGNSKMGRKSNLLIGIDLMSFSSRWIVTGTPSHGLFGVDNRMAQTDAASQQACQAQAKDDTTETSAEMEKKDLERLGSITSLFLKARPWANTNAESDDGLAEWRTYLLLPRHSKHGRGNWTCLTSTLESLIIRHQLSEIGNLLPTVDEKVIVLDGSYQDRLSLDLFAMMIIFNSVQSQRTDKDYFFHPNQRKSLMQVVHNLKQASFFGGSFFTAEEIAVSVETAEKFLEEGKVPISPEDLALLLQAIQLGRVAIQDNLRNLGNRYHDIPILIEGPNLGNISRAWSLNGEGGDRTCTSASLILSLRRLLAKTAHDVEALNSLLNGGLAQVKLLDKDKSVTTKDEAETTGDGKRKRRITLAGNTNSGTDPRHGRRRSQGAVSSHVDALPVGSLPSSLQQARVVSTASAKLSYLLDSVLRHQYDEKIIIFYENENVAWYLASALDMLQIQHLIYAKSLTSARKAQYVHTFNTNAAFRVLLMDLSQAAFGLDMREASRVYFINPVLNPQVEAQAIGRVRRISQQKPVTVETLVLKDSIDEVILERKGQMTQAEHRQIKSLLDVRPIYNWIKNAAILDLPSVDADIASHMTQLTTPQHIFARDFGTEDAAEDWLAAPESPARAKPAAPVMRKRGRPSEMEVSADTSLKADRDMTRPGRRVRFT